MGLAQPIQNEVAAEDFPLLTPRNIYHLGRRAYSVEEYLAMERAAEERHIYLDGRIFTLSGESPAHSSICFNLAAILGVQLRGTPCRGFSPNMKVRSGPYHEGQRTAKGFFSYPDVSVCGEPQFHDHFRDVLLNPTVIIEVLSDSTTHFDRGEKLLRYRQYIETLTDYILVWQDRAIIEHFHRQPDGQWTHTPYIGLENSVAIASLECLLHLSEVYDRVEFPPLEEIFAEERNL